MKSYARPNKRDKIRSFLISEFYLETFLNIFFSADRYLHVRVTHRFIKESHIFSFLSLAPRERNYLYDP